MYFEYLINFFKMNMTFILQPHQIIVILFSFFNQLIFFNLLNILINLQYISLIYRAIIWINIINNLDPIIISFASNWPPNRRFLWRTCSLNIWTLFTTLVIINNNIFITNILELIAFTASIWWLKSRFVIILFGDILLCLILYKHFLFITLFVHLALFLCHDHLLLFRPKHALLAVCAIAALGAASHGPDGALLLSDIWRHLTQIFWQLWV